MADKWIKLKPDEVQVGDICKRNPKWDNISEKRIKRDIETNGWTQDEEFIVAEIRPYDYVRCDRKWIVCDDFDWTKMYDENNTEDKKILDDMGRDGDKRDSVFFLSTNMLWLSKDSKRERELSKLLS